MSDHYTSKKDFDLFQLEFLKWRVRFGMVEWEVYFEHGKSDGEAEIEFNDLDKTANVTLANNWNQGEVSRETIWEVALHEAVHLALEPLTFLAKNRYATEEEIDRANEDLARKLVFGIKHLKSGGGPNAQGVNRAASKKK